MHLHAQRLRRTILQPRGLLLVVLVLALLGVVYTLAFSHSTALPFATIAEDDWLVRRGDGNYLAHPDLREPVLFILTRPADVTNFVHTFQIPPEQLGTEAQFGQIVGKLQHVDFTQDCVVIVFHGTRGSTGYGITVESVRQQGDRVQLYAHFTSAKGSGGAAITDPYHIITINKASFQGHTVTFELRDWWRPRAVTSEYIPK